jgi:hypothetical protein
VDGRVDGWMRWDGLMNRRMGERAGGSVADRRTGG